MQDKLIIAPGTDADQYYATGLGLDTFITLVRGKKTIVAAGGFEYPQAKAKYPQAIRFADLGKTFPEVVTAFCKRYKVKKPVMPAQTRADIAKLVPGAVLSAELFSERRVKRADEIKKIKAVQTATEEAFRIVKETLLSATVKQGKAYLSGKPLTSEQLKRLAAMKLAEYNCACPEMIIASAGQGALPHHRGSGQIREGAIVVDIFPQSNETRYFSDCTRTFVLGKAPATFAERYEAVLAVNKRAQKRAKHGAENIDALSRKDFEELGFTTDFKKGTGYIHSLGHGVGLEIHEQPRLREKLVAGNVITIEPGLYYDYGIRIEDIGVVTKSGFNCFSKFSKEPHI